MKYESAPNCVSYEALLRIIQARPTYGKPHAERLYIVDLSNKLASLNRKTMSEIAGNWDDGSDPESSDSPNH